MSVSDKTVTLYMLTPRKALIEIMNVSLRKVVAALIMCDED